MRETSRCTLRVRVIRETDRPPTLQTVNPLQIVEREMNLKTGREIAAIGIRLADDAYMAWLGAEFDAEQALRVWREGRGRPEGAYHAYRAAADREEAAARDLERLLDLTCVCEEALVVAE
jgi:hypothetical protein